MFRRLHLVAAPTMLLRSAPAFYQAAVARGTRSIALISATAG